MTLQTLQFCQEKTLYVFYPWMPAIYIFLLTKKYKFSPKTSILTYFRIIYARNDVRPFFLVASREMSSSAISRL